MNKFKGKKKNDYLKLLKYTKKKIKRKGTNITDPSSLHDSVSNSVKKC